MRIKKNHKNLASKSFFNQKTSYREVKNVDARTKDVHVVGKRVISENRELLDKLKEY